jgi:hypothetical protein
MGGWGYTNALDHQGRGLLEGEMLLWGGGGEEMGGDGRKEMGEGGRRWKEGDGRREDNEVGDRDKGEVMEGVGGG